MLMPRLCGAPAERSAWDAHTAMNAGLVDRVAQSPGSRELCASQAHRRSGDPTGATAALLSAVARPADVLAGGRIRDDLQAHLAVARLA